MKKIFIAASLLLSFYAEAQQANLSTRAFWQGKPTLAQIQSEIEKEKFSFTAVTNGDDPLSLAISNDASLDVISFLAAQPGVDFKRGIHEGRTYLHAAASKGNAEAVNVLLKKGSDMHYTDAHGQTALTYAAFMGRITLPVLEAFVKNGFDVKKKFETKENANILLLAAGSDKDMAITNYLLKKGVPLNSTDKNGATAFDYAAKQGNVAILKALAAKGVKHSDKALFMAAQGPFRSANKIDVYQYLVDELKIDPKATNKSGQNVLHLVVTKQNQADIISYFFNKGVDINTADAQGNTPFIGATATKSTETVALLLTKVKNINAVNAKGESALTNAVKAGNAAVVNLLLKSGADALVLDKDGNNLAFYLVEGYRGAGGRGGFAGAGAGANTGGTQAHTEEGAGPNGGNRGGRTNAAAQESPAKDFGEKLASLKEKGLDFTKSTKDGSTLYHLAIVKNDLEVLKKISTLGIDINAKNKEGLTVLHKAAMLSKSDAILRYLVSSGASKEVKTNFDETAYDLASENGFLKKDKVALEFLK